MKITRLAVQHVRIHTLKTLNLEPGTTLISGPNGSGKTSLIEAIHIALRGTSFRGSDEAVCQHEQKSYTIDLATDEQHYRVQYDRRHETKRKRFIVDGTTYGRLPYGKKYPIVLFEPDTLRIITGSPQRRRDFLDILIQQYDAHYSHELSRYHRALQQRNKLLKDPALSEATLFSWNLILSQYGASIITKRQQVLRYLNAKSSAMYQSIAGAADSVALHYSEERSSSLLSMNKKRRMTKWLVQRVLARTGMILWCYSEAIQPPRPHRGVKSAPLCLPSNFSRRPIFNSKQAKHHSFCSTTSLVSSTSSASSASLANSLTIRL